MTTPEPGPGPGDAPRVAPGTLRDLGPAGWAFAQAARRVTGTLAAPQVFTVLGRTRCVFWGWLHFAGRLMRGSTLPARDVELVILRVAHLRGSSYEWEHHVPLGRRAGLAPREIERVRLGASADGWSERESALLSAAEELVTDREVGDRTWTRLAAVLDERASVELLLLAGHYDMLASVLASLRLKPDRRARP